jgi:hypothetical protein
MKEKYIKVCREIEDLLNDSMESSAQKLVERDRLLQIELDTFEESLLPSQMQHWDIIREQVDNIRMYAKLGKMRLMDGDKVVSNLFSNYQSKLEKLDCYDEAALEIHREMHEPSSISGIFKSLFMWKETPEERLKENSQK